MLASATAFGNEYRVGRLGIAVRGQPVVDRYSLVEAPAGWLCARPARSSA